MRCQALTLRGERCRELRIEWLRYVEIDDSLMCFCSRHIDALGHRLLPSVSALSLRNFGIFGDRGRIRQEGKRD